MVLVLDKASGRQSGENVSVGKGAEAFPDMGPLYVASSQLTQVTKCQVNVD